MSATGANAPKLTYAQLKAKKTRRTITHPVVTDDDCRKAYDLADQAVVRAAARGDADALSRAQALLAEAETELREATLLLRVRALAPDAYASLKAEHPPTDADHARAAERSGDPKAQAKWHPETFGPALVAACLAEPKVTVEQAAEMKADWNDAEWAGVLYAAIQVNETATEVPAGLVFS